MTNKPNTEAEVNKFDQDEAELRQQAVDNGFSKEELKIADADIADERTQVEAGAETAEEAEDNLNERILADLDNASVSG